jgi:hypothetical protein
MDKKLGGSESYFLPQKCSKTRLHASAISKNFLGLYPRSLLKWGRGGMERRLGKVKERKGEGEKGGEDG